MKHVSPAPKMGPVDSVLPKCCDHPIGPLVVSSQRNALLINKQHVLKFK